MAVPGQDQRAQPGLPQTQRSPEVCHLTPKAFLHLGCHELVPGLHLGCHLCWAPLVPEASFLSTGQAEADPGRA